jgi:hypothetical protein
MYKSLKNYTARPSYLQVYDTHVLRVSLQSDSIKQQIQQYSYQYEILAI